MIIKMKNKLVNIINEEILKLNRVNENTYKVYHGTNQEFDKFDFNRAAQGIVWFTDNPESIEKGEHGGMGNKIIMTRYITINNPAGWDEYEKYGLQQLEDMGYDGVILPQGDKTDYFVFSNKSIRKNIVREGVADTYGEKFGLRNTAKEMDRKATASIPPTPNMGEFIGDVIDEDYFYGDDNDDKGPVDTKLSRVFMNPPSLQKFEPDVRAISDEEGNLFVAETDGRFYHTNLEHTVLGSGQYKGYDFIQWYRVNTTDEFRLANSYGSFAPALAWKDLVAQVNVLKEKQPQFRFKNAVNTFESIVGEEIEKYQISLGSGL